MSEIRIELSPPPAGRLVALDELKGLAIALIILFHAGGVLVWNNYLHGDLGVDMFIFLSGLGLAYGSRSGPAGAFLLRRAWRILPAYWVVLTIYLIGNRHFLQLHYSTPNVVAHYLGIQVLFGDPWGLAINDSFWFVSAILGLYVCYLPFRRLLERPDRFLLAAAILSTGVALLLFFTNNSGLTGLLGFRMGGFFLGMLAGHTLKTGRLVVPLNSTLALGMLIFGYVPYMRGITFFSSLVALAVMAAYVWWLRPRLANPRAGGLAGILAFLGRHSLEIFLIHQPLMREYNYYLLGRWFHLAQPGAGPLIAGMAVALVVTLVASVELHRLLQKLPNPVKA